MKGWETRRLADIADFCLGKMLDQRKNRGELLPYLANINVRWGDFDLSDLRTMRFGPHEMDRYGLRYGDIVMCEGGEPGRCAIWKENQPGMMFQKALHRIRPHHSLDNSYLYYSFLLMGRTGQLAQYFTGATIKHMPREKLAKVEITQPPLEIQQRIAEVLSAYDDLIANNRRRIQLLEDAARLLYREWFVRLRFPGHEHAKIRDGIPEGWEKVQLAKLAEVNRASIGQHFQGEIEYIDISAVSPGHIEQTTTYEFSAAPSRARRVVQHGDIIWSCVRPNRRSHAVIWHPQENLIASTGFAVITPTAVPTSFLYQAVTTDDFVGRLVANARGVAYPAVTAPVFESALILAPPGALLAQYNELAEPMLEQISILRQQTQRLARARDLLLPKLMNGEVAV